MTAPWTPRERALYEALELARPMMNRIDHNVGAYDKEIAAEELVDALLADPPPTDPRDAALRLAEAELLRLWKLVPAGCAGVGGVRTIELEDDEVARLRQIVDAIRAAKGER